MWASALMGQIRPGPYHIGLEWCVTCIEIINAEGVSFTTLAVVLPHLICLRTIIVTSWPAHHNAMVLWDLVDVLAPSIPKSLKQLMLSMKSVSV
jgi:hypothetical protein